LRAFAVWTGVVPGRAEYQPRSRGASGQAEREFAAPLLRSPPGGNPGGTKFDWKTTLAAARLTADWRLGYSPPIPARGSTRCRMAARQINTTSSLRRLASRPSRTNFSMAQKQIAPTTQIIRIPIRSEIIAIPILRPGPRRPCQANVPIWNCKIMSFGAERSLALTVHPMSRLSRHPSPRRPQFAPRAGAVTLCTYLGCQFGSSIIDRSARFSWLPGMGNRLIVSIKVVEPGCSIPKTSDAAETGGGEMSDTAGQIS
jgi:hypothetical protein